MIARRSRVESMAVVRAALAADCACDEAAFLTDGNTLVEAAERLGRRRFPIACKPLLIVSFGAGVVVSAHPDRLPALRSLVGSRSRDEVFGAATIAELAGLVAADGQVLLGPQLKHVCAEVDLRPVPTPDGVAIRLVEGADVSILQRYRGFSRAIAYRVGSSRPDVGAALAVRAGEVVGIAGASADCDDLWQIGIEVAPDDRGQGIGRALVGELTRWVLEQGRVPYYSTTVANIDSRALAAGVGYRPAWVELYAVDPAAEPTAAR
jgi:GNAT superfamily N-acetyltransferase